MSKPYSEYKSTPEKWIGDVPIHWSLERIKYGLTEKPARKNPDLPSGAISYGRVVAKDAEKILPETRATYQEVLSGEYLINPINLNYDLISLRTALSSLDVCVSPAYIVLNARPEKVVPAFGNYVLHVFDVQHMKTLGAGVRQTITFKDIGHCVWALPPREEQTAIANFLDRKTARIDGLIEKKGRFIELLKEKRSAQITAAVTGKIDVGGDCGVAGGGDGMNISFTSSRKKTGLTWAPDIPSDWDVKRGKFLFDLQKRRIKDGDDIVTAFRDGQVTLRKNRRTDGFTNALKEAGYQRVHQGDLVIHAMDAFAGAVGVSDSDGKCTPVYSCCTPKPHVSAEFYARLIRTMALSGFIESLAKGIRERSTDFRWREFAEQSLPVPPYQKQLEINAFLDRETARIDGLIAKTQRSIELLKEKRSALITAAVTGKIDVRSTA
ncbi:restriction endonuclease subunit S [Celeribacter sp.]|uniref:restriction endonuclease subunit S n=1 Tax=Celeribacter sp. TaxID=1890673 RepID=UPI003A92C793